MLQFLIPSAKEMVEEKPKNIARLHSDKTTTIVKEMVQKDIPELLRLYHFKKEEAALKEQQRWKDIDSGNSSSYKAIELYNGLMYRSLKTNLSSNALEYLTQTTYITTALYGIIPINDIIHPHRLDFNTSTLINNQSLKQFWKEEYDNFLIKSNEQEAVISLLSSEFENIFSPEQRQQLIKVKFYEQTSSGKLKQHSTISKKGRGYFLHAAAENECQTIDDLKKLTFEGYHFEESELKNELIFIRSV